MINKKLKFLDFWHSFFFPLATSILLKYPLQKFTVTIKFLYLASKILGELYAIQPTVTTSA